VRLDIPLRQIDQVGAERNASRAAQAAGWPVVPVHDGWYADDNGGGVAICGQGMFWEVRDTPCSIKQACGPEAWPPRPSHDNGAEVNVQQAVFPRVGYDRAVPGRSLRNSGQAAEVSLRVRDNIFTTC
jgi:hypothetical protein